MSEIIQFQQKIYDFYRQNRRDFAWRHSITPYRIVVSEIMLQQTQTSRVIHKFDQWLLKFPDFETLAQASVQQVLFAWQGLGYNRRGLALHEFAKRVVSEFGGQVPIDPDILKTFKGIGSNTAGSICAFAFNMPVTFIETNIRTVFIHEFFKEVYPVILANPGIQEFTKKSLIDDKQLLPLITAAVDQANPREWYYALMDYGVYLKKELKVSNKASKHYAKQSKFIGSKRQVRGAVIRILSTVKKISFEELQELILFELPDNRHDLDDVVKSLCLDGFLEEKGYTENKQFICIKN